MPIFHLLSTRRNPDGSFATPSVDEILHASDLVAAVKQAARFPLEGFDADSDTAWLVDESGTVVWSQDLTLSSAA